MCDWPTGRLAGKLRSADLAKAGRTAVTVLTSHRSSMASGQPPSRAAVAAAMYASNRSIESPGQPSRRSIAAANSSRRRAGSSWMGAVPAGSSPKKTW